MTLAQSEPKIVYKIAPEAQAIYFRRRHQPSRPPLAKIKPGSPVPTWGMVPAERPSYRHSLETWSLALSAVKIGSGSGHFSGRAGRGRHQRTRLGLVGR